MKNVFGGRVMQVLPENSSYLVRITMYEVMCTAQQCLWTCKKSLPQWHSTKGLIKLKKVKVQTKMDNRYLHLWLRWKWSAILCISAPATLHFWLELHIILQKKITYCSKHYSYQMSFETVASRNRNRKNLCENMLTVVNQ